LLLLLFLVLFTFAVPASIKLRDNGC
jgi:hypothetical protein